MSSFIGGAATSAVLINWARHRALRSEYALPLVLEAVLLVCFGVLGGSLQQHQWLFAPMTVSLLCFVMGLQNAMITKLSRAEIRTTHVTGLVTDIGIELGKLVYVNARSNSAPVLANRQRLRIHSLLLASFLAGGLFGAFGFKYAGFVTTVPLAIALSVLSLRPLLHDLRRRGPHSI